MVGPTMYWSWREVQVAWIRRQVHLAKGYTMKLKEEINRLCGELKKAWQGVFGVDFICS